MKFKKLIQRIKDYIYDSTIDLKDRSFIVFSVILIAELILFAIPLGFLMKEPLSSALSTFAGAVLFGLYVFYAIRRKKIATAKVVVSVVLVLVFLPAMFFTNGGVYSGAPVSLVLGGLYINLILTGRAQTIMNVLYSITMIVCWCVEYYHPELVTEYTRKGTYIDSLSGVLIVNAVMIVLLSFHTKLYSRENEIAREKTKELEEVNRSQNRFFSSMSHEIRTPINTVLGLNEIILRQEDASEEIRKDARNIQGAGKLLLALINDILDISKIEAGKMDIVPVNYNVSALLSEIVNMIWLKAEEKGLKFNVDIDPNVPEMLFGDEIRIKQILINLLNNAVKYTKEGSISLHMECEFPDDKNALFKIVVSDTGMGIKPEALPHLFDSFQRVDEEKNRHIEGTGLGLSIVKQLVELMDGDITVSSVYTQGSVFTVTLKQGISSDKKIGDINIANAGGVNGSEKFEHCFHAPTARILIVDDNEMNLQVEQKLLEGTDMTVDLALSGEEALKNTLRYYYDVIFMDHLMPEMDGIECFERIRNQNGGLNRTVPIIVLTANAGGENIELYNNTGFDGYLVKPVSGVQLENMLMTHLPREKVISGEGSEMTGAQLNTASGYARKKPVLIATSTMSDLPGDVYKELDIAVLPYTVHTDEGVFFDNIDIDSDELVRYMGEELRLVTSEPPSVDSYIGFFSEGLKKAHNIIYIALTTGSSREYDRACEAAKTFENVTVINSEYLSSATGLLVMIAGKLAKQNTPADKIVAEIEAAKKLIHCSFIIKNTDTMSRRGHIGPAVNNILNTLWLRPVLRVKNNQMGVGKFFMGSERRCYENYIKYALPAGGHPDTGLVFVTCAGMSEEDIVWIENMVRERFNFEHIIFKKASAGIASNCGPGTFGLLFLEKGDRNYNLESLLDKNAHNESASYHEEEEEEEIPDDETEVNDAENEDETPVPAQEEKDDDDPIKKIEGIDYDAAIKNSGSKDAFLSVIKMYYDSYALKSQEIMEYYENGDWKNYTIKVHALKSSSRLVGALDLGNSAEALEKAGKSDDLTYIKEHHEEMMDSYKKIIDSLDLIFGKEEEELPEIPPDTLVEAYQAIQEFANIMDYDCAMMVIDSLKEFSLPKEDKERFEKINKLLSDMDWEGLKEIVGSVI
ncbi:MAG: DegV family EDD domain-containing protein [Lachnospiraceae bacterium]|nr:DegV family EDD domain-containing protein [Lachnospiraceae bacterium]